jgi:hypothetical protein
MDVPIGQAAETLNVFGFDYSGFSSWVQDRIEAEGEAAAEGVSDRLDTAFRRIEAGLRTAGFEPLETLGDGLIAVTDRAGPSEAALADIVARAGIGLPFRSASVLGPVRPIRLFDRLTLWAGGGIVRCHAVMRLGALRRGEDQPAVTQASTPHRLVRAAIVRGTVGFVCIRQPDAELPDNDLQAVARLIDASAAAYGSAIEKATQDEKGLLLRAHFDTDAQAGEWARCVAEGLGSGLDFGIGLAHGLLYRSTPSDGAAPVVHGVAVNRAAKLAGQARGWNDAPVIAPALATRAFAARSDIAPGGPKLRAQEEAEVVAALAGGASMVEIVGEPGLGKSFLLNCVLRRGPGRVIATSARPQDLLKPFGVLENLLRRAAPTEVERAFDSADRHGEAELIAWGERIRAALRRRLAEGPALFVVDDLQWADAWSLKAMEALRAEGLRFLVARRPGIGAPLADRSIKLHPLSDAAVRALLGPLGDDPALVRLTGGNPFHAVQLYGALREGVRIEDRAGADAIVDARLRALADTDRAILRLAAVAARPLFPATLAELARRSAFAFEPGVLDTLVTRRFFHAEEGRFAIVHQLLADRLLAMLPPSLAPSLHHDTARTFVALAREGREPIALDEIAAHWTRAGSRGRASLGFGRAGLEALDRGAHAAALDFLDRAEVELRQTAVGASRRGLWAASRALAAWGQGRVAECAAEADRAFRQLAVARRGACAESGRRTRAARLRASVARAEAGHYRGDLRAILGGNLGVLRWSTAGNDLSSARARGLACVATTLGVLRSGPIAAFATRRALAIDPAPRSAAYVHAARAVVHLGFGQWSRARGRLDQATTALADDPEPQLAEVLLTLTALRQQMTGDLAGGRDSFLELGRSARARGNALIEAWSRYGVAMGLVSDGGFAPARDEIVRARALFHGLGDLQSELICYGLMAQASATLDPDAALAACRAAEALAARLPPTNFGSLEGYSGGALALARRWRLAGSSGERDAVRTHYDALRRPLRRYCWTFPIGRPRLAFADALMAGDEARMDRASAAAARIGMLADARNMAADGSWRTTP